MSVYNKQFTIEEVGNYTRNFAFKKVNEFSICEALGQVA
jgi:hypothetical protein